MPHAIDVKWAGNKAGFDTTDDAIDLVLRVAAEGYVVHIDLDDSPDSYDLFVRLSFMSYNTGHYFALDDLGALKAVIVNPDNKTIEPAGDSGHYVYFH